MLGINPEDVKAVLQQIQHPCFDIVLLETSYLFVRRIRPVVPGCPGEEGAETPQVVAVRLDRLRRVFPLNGYIIQEMLNHVHLRFLC